MHIRFFRFDDLQALAALINRDDSVDGTGRRTAPPELDRWLDEPGERIRENTLVLDTGAGLAGYLSLCFVRQAGGTAVFGYGAVDPDRRREGHGTRLMRAGIAHLEAIAGLLNERVVFNQMVFPHIAGHLELAHRVGMEPASELVSMRRADLGALPPAALPAGFTLRVATAADAAAWVDIRRDAFAWDPDCPHPSAEGLAAEMDDPRAVRLTLSDESGRPVGFCACEVRQDEGGTPGGHVSTVAVRRAWQGRGIGKALLLAGLRALHEAGASWATLTVDAGNPTAALPLYERTGFEPWRRVVRCERVIPHTAQKQRAAVILVQDGSLALIRRVRGDEVYYLFPGGGVDPGESAEEAAVREAHEELGLHVELERLAAVVERNGARQYHFLARAVGGRFGSGTGEEMTLDPDSDRGSYVPVWVELTDLPRHQVRPRALADAVRLGKLGAAGEGPLHIQD